MKDNREVEIALARNDLIAYLKKLHKNGKITASLFKELNERAKNDDSLAAAYRDHATRCVGSIPRSPDASDESPDKSFVPRFQTLSPPMSPLRLAGGADETPDNAELPAWLLANSTPKKEGFLTASSSSNTVASMVGSSTSSGSSSSSMWGMNGDQSNPSGFLKFTPEAKISATSPLLPNQGHNSLSYKQGSHRVSGPTSTMSSPRSSLSYRHLYLGTDANAKQRSKEQWPSYISTEELISTLVDPRSHLKLRNIFMLNYRPHIEPHALLTQLLHYYANPPSQTDDEIDGGFVSLSFSGSFGGMTTASFMGGARSPDLRDGAVNASARISGTIAGTNWDAASKVKVCAWLNHWIKRYYDDFSPHMKAQLSDFFSEHVIEGESGEEAGGAAAVKGPKFVIHLKNKWKQVEEEQTQKDARGSEEKIRRSKGRWDDRCRPEDFRPKRLDLLSLSAVELARELTISDFRSLSRIQSIELTDHMWKKDPDRAVHVCRFIEQFNSSTFWIAARILSRKTLLERQSMYLHWICIAEECMKLHNYHAVFYILSAFTMHQVHRLKELKTMELDYLHQRKLDELKQLTSSKQNYSEYRRRVDECFEQNIPCILHLGICLKDLLLYETITPAERELRMLDIHRMATVGREIDRIDAVTRMSFKQLLPETNSRLRKTIDSLRKTPITRQELMDRSMELEPKMTWVEHRQRLCLATLLEEGLLG